MTSHDAPTSSRDHAAQFRPFASRARVIILVPVTCAFRSRFTPTRCCERHPDANADFIQDKRYILAHWASQIRRPQAQVPRQSRLSRLTNTVMVQYHNWTSATLHFQYEP